MKKLLLMILCAIGYQALVASEGSFASVSREEQIRAARERGMAARAATAKIVSMGAPYPIGASVSGDGCYTFFNCAAFHPVEFDIPVPVITPFGLAIRMVKTSTPMLRDIIRLEHEQGDEALPVSRALLVNAYKIHIMPTKSQLPSVLFHILKRIATDGEFAHLVRSMKAINSVDYLCCSASRHDLIGVERQLVLPMIVLYAAPGKDKAQRLVQELHEMLKAFHGITQIEATASEVSSRRFSVWRSEDGTQYTQLVTPRFNVPYSDLIFYAQADADDKYDPELRDACFDARFNSAIFKQAFLGDHGPLPEDYLLAGSPLGKLTLAEKQ